jgi:hypothetical protein
MSSMRSVGSAGSQGSGDGRYIHHSSHARGPYLSPPGAAHLMNGETQFPPSMYHAASDAAKSDVATVCSGSVVEDIEEESILSCEMGGQQRDMNPHSSPPSSVKMAFDGGMRRSNSAGNRLVDFADRSQEIPAAVIPQQGAGFHALPTMLTDEDITVHDNDMGPPLSRTLLLQRACSSQAGSFESNAGSDVIAHVDTDDCGGSLIESITDAHSIHSQEEASMINPNAGEVASKPAANPPADTTPPPHPLLCSASDSTSNGRTSPGGTIYKGRGVRRYQGRFMHLPLKRFHQNGVHLRPVDEHVDGEGFDHYPAHYGNHAQWEDRYDAAPADTWERDRVGNERTRGNSPRARRNCFAHKRSRSRSRSRSPVDTGRMRSRSPENGRTIQSRSLEPNDEKEPSRYSDRDNRKHRARRSNGYQNGHDSNGYRDDDPGSPSSHRRGYRSRDRGGGRGSHNNPDFKESSSNRNGTRNKHRRR